MKSTLDTNNPIVLIGCFDTKEADFHFLYQCLRAYDKRVITVNVGIMGTTTLFPVDIESDQVAGAVNENIYEMRSQKNRESAIDIMGRGGSKVLAQLFQDEGLAGVIGMGGGGGTFLLLNAMQSIPFGVPKLCVSTLASKDLSSVMGGKDIVLMPSVVDVAGLNQISRQMIQFAAGALVGMIESPSIKSSNAIGNIAISVFGNTTLCVDKCSEILKDKGYDVYSFHAVGVGGKTMESLILDGFFDAVLDITTTELADDLCGGICSAGSDRLTAAGKVGIPQVVVPGCLDMVNFGPKETVPERYQRRQLFSWAPDVTLMRTDEVENRWLGKSIAEKVNASKGDSVVIFPLGGLSIVSGKGEVFYKPEVDAVLFNTIKDNLESSIPFIEVNANINTEEFAVAAVEELLKLLSGKI